MSPSAFETVASTNCYTEYPEHQGRCNTHLELSADPNFLVEHLDGKLLVETSQYLHFVHHCRVELHQLMGCLQFFSTGPKFAMNS